MFVFFCLFFYCTMWCYGLSLNSSILMSFLLTAFFVVFLLNSINIFYLSLNCTSIAQFFDSNTERVNKNGFHLLWLKWKWIKISNCVIVLISGYIVENILKQCTLTQKVICIKITHYEKRLQRNVYLVRAPPNLQPFLFLPLFLLMI